MTIERRWCGLAIFLSVAAVYIHGAAPAATPGDAGELALAGFTLGIPHPPGYPVFALVQHLFGSVVSLGNPAFRQNIAGGALIALALVMLAILIVRLTGQRWTLVLPALLLTAPLLRRAGQVTEVFPLTFFWASLLLLAVFQLSKRPAGGLAVAFLLGLGAAIHQTLLLMAPALAFYFLRQQPEPARVARRLALPCGAAFLGGLTIFLYLPIRASTHPVLNWEDPETLRRFWGVVTRARYGFFQLAQGPSASRFSLGALWGAVAHARRFHVDNLGWTGTALVAFGSLHSLARRYHRRFMVTCWLHILFTGPFFFWFTGVPYGGGDSGLLSRFALLPLAGGAALIALGLAPLWSSGLRLYRAFMVALLVLFLGEGVARNRVEAAPSLRWDASIREAGLNTLRSAPAEGTLFADRADETEFSLAYLLNGENRRPGLRFIDCNAGVTTSIYGDDYDRIWGPPRLQLRERVESAIVNAARLPVVYATLDPTMIDVYRAPAGLLYRALPMSLAPAKPNAVAWDRLLAWRSVPREPRSRALLRTDFDLVARTLFDAGQWEGALALFGQSQRLGGPNRWEQLGYWFQVRGNQPRAQDAYQKADAAGDESEAFFSNFGALLTDSGHVVPAIELYERGLTLFPDSEKILYNLAVARWETGAPDEAQRLARRVLELDPTNVDAQRLLVRRPDGNRI